MFCIKCGKKAVTRKFLKNISEFSVEKNPKKFYDFSTKNNLCENCFLASVKLIKEKDFKINVCKCEDELKLIAHKLSDYKIGEICRIGGGYEIELRKDKKFGELVKKESKKIKVLIKTKKCDRCIKIAGGYNEAIIQLRDKAVDLVDMLDKEYVAGVEKTKHGIDVKMLNKKYAKKMCKKFKDLKFEVKTSFKLMGMKKGKEIIKDFFSVKPGR